MTEKELKDKIMITLSKNEGETNIDIDKFSIENNLEYSSSAQRNRIFSSLKEEGYIASRMGIGENGDIYITSKGIAYADGINHEEVINKHKDSEKVIDEPILIDTPLKYEKDPSLYLRAKEEQFKIQTKSVAPCFNVDFYAKIFANHIDNMKSEDSQMIGIFGTWGRGKTYFWEKIKLYLDQKKYTFVEFNAWKYQETPALWAYLYKTFQDTIMPTYWEKLIYNIKQNWLKSITNLFILVIFVVMIVFGLLGIKNPTAKWIISIISALFFLWSEITKNISPIIDSLKKAITGKDYSSHLGCQAEIEGDLVKLIKQHSPEKQTDSKKIVLFVDDIDRCEDGKMIKITDSLRTVLENSDISKRLIIVCAIDGQRLQIALERRYNTSGDNKHLVREQMDKIFLSGIKLRPIFYDEQVSFIKKLISTPDKKDSTIEENAINKHTVDSAKIDGISHYQSMEINQQDIMTVFRKILNDTDASEITPRQLRIIYYRYRLANNILKGDQIPHDAIAKSIYSKTLGKDDCTDLAASYRDVVNTVVCY
jgi:hypothetical protein